MAAMSACNSPATLRVKVENSSVFKKPMSCEALGTSTAAAHLLLHRHAIVQHHQALDKFCLFSVLNEVLAALVLLDLGGTFQQGFQRTIGVDEFRTGLEADPRHARHIVHAVTGKGLHVHHLVWGHLNFSSTCASPISLSFMVSNNEMPGFTSCIQVLVDETMRQVAPASAA